MNKIFSIWFHQLGISDSIKLKIYNQVMDFEAIFKLSNNNYKQLGLNEDQIDKIIKSKETISQIRETLEQIRKENIQIIDIGEKEYPEELKQIINPPMVLFAQGNIQYLNSPAIAIVGARKCSEYGFEIAKKIAKELAQRGIVVVSGMALGIDEAAHRGALEIGHTVAVLGTGVSVCYPKKNYELYRRIPNKGCLVSEYLPHTEPMPFQFPQRNRIISGISVGTVLVEAAEKSGSLITADLALEQNKLVFAVPGNVNSKLSKGTNHLIQQGAKLITNSQDIMDELPSYIMKKIDLGNKNLIKLDCNLLDKVEIMVYDCLSWQPKEINELITNTGITSETINTILLKLEIKGLIQRLPGNRYLRLN
ncbi:MAG: DNA-processing protein DprA [Cellulosilyticaceae bacterium]